MNFTPHLEIGEPCEEAFARWWFSIIRLGRGRDGDRSRTSRLGTKRLAGRPEDAKLIRLVACVGSMRQ